MLNEYVEKIYNEDCVEGMKKLPDECVDLVATDCPYLLISGGCSNGEYRTSKGNRQMSGVMNRLRQRDYVPVEGNYHGHTMLAGTKHVNLGGVLDDQANDVRAGKMFSFNEVKFSEWLPEVYRVLKPDTHCYIMINSRNLKDLQIEAEKVGFKFQNLLVWRKNSATPNKFYMQQLEFILMLRKGHERWVNDMGMSNCLSVPNIIGTKCHPTEKPISLMRVLIEQSTKKGDIVLDPFMGSGATALAAIQSERHYVGFEIDPKYYEVCQKRIHNTPVQKSLFDD